MIKTVQNLEFGQPLSKIFMFVNSSKNLDFSQDFRYIWVLVELLKKTLKFGQIFGKILTYEKIFEKSRLWLKFSEFPF